MGCAYCTNRTKHGHDAAYIQQVKRAASKLQKEPKAMKTKRAEYLGLACNACDALDDFVEENSAGYCQGCWKECQDNNERDGINPNFKKENQAMKTTHTETPWRVGEGRTNLNGDAMKTIKGADGIIFAFVSDENLITNPRQEANAAFIVTACNAHEGLITAIGTAVEIIRNSFGDEPGAESDCQAVRILEAALNAAKGE